jgi:crotonobetainyl-CoA:carnitine CoA-transferase CaiB-like acyl-CoA transferase
MRTFGEAGIPASAVFDTMELSEDPALRERGTFISVEYAPGRSMTIPGFVVKMSGSQVEIAPPPEMGADNADIYANLLGLSDLELATLQKEGVI